MRSFTTFWPASKSAICISGNTILLLFLVLLTLSACGKKPPISVPTSKTKGVFDSIPTAYPVIPMISEISGIADSKSNPGFLWAEQDSDNDPLIFLISHDGKVKKQVYIKAASDRDWEDMAISGNEIYLGDIGDNYLKHPGYYFYHFKEPSASQDTVYTVDTIQFKYPDGHHNAEAFLIDSATKDIFIITKNDSLSILFKLSPPFQNNEIQIARAVGKLSYSTVVSACQSPDGKEIIIKTYLGLQYYKRSAGQSIPEALSQKYQNLPYLFEPQGEAVTFANDNSGIYTLSEKGFANFVNLYFYKRH